MITIDIKSLDSTMKRMMVQAAKAHARPMRKPIFPPRDCPT